MSSQKVDVSSIQEYSENAQKVGQEKNKDMLHPSWSYFQRENKIKAKSTCGLSSKKGSQEDQVFYYKQKAHQSFMQVIQVQQLHQQEIQQLKQDYEQKIRNLEDEIRQKKSVIQMLQKNSSRHLIEFKKSLEIDDIGMIQCREPNLSRFDDSTLLTFKQFLTEKQSDAKVASMREGLFNFITHQLKKYLSNPQQLTKNIKKEVNSIFQYVKQVRHQLLTKMQSYEALLKKYEQMDANHKKLKQQYELVEKDAFRMSQNLKKLKNEKISLERKNLDLQKKLNDIGKQVRFKQNYLKTSLNDLQKGPLSSRKTIEPQKQIIKNGPETLKISKTKFDPKANKSDINLQTNNSEKLFISAAKFQYLPKEDDSFDVQDLIAEMNVDPQRLSLNPDRNQKRTQLMVSQPLGSKIRRKSFDN